MPTYRLLQIKDSNGDYWIITSSEQAKENELGYFRDPIKSPFVCYLTDTDVAHFGTHFHVPTVIGQSRQVHENVPLFDLPDELIEKKFHVNPILFGMEYYNPDLHENDIWPADDYKRKMLIYTEQDLRRCWKECLEYTDWLMDRGSKRFENYTPLNLEDFIQSLNKPKQFIVEIEMERFEKPVPFENTGTRFVVDYRPKLNSEGKITIKSYKEV